MGAASKAYGLPEGRGVAFYKFERIGSSPADLKSFKKMYRSSLDALQVSTAQADEIVREANLAFLLNILIFEERDVAAGHLSSIRTIEELNDLVESHRSPLAFQKAYGTTSSQASEQCPFIPGPAGRRAQGQPSFHERGHGVCPWPFVWFHDPKSAVVAHPCKNVLGLITLAGMLRVAWQHPKRCMVALFGTTFATLLAKPTIKRITKK